MKWESLVLRLGRDCLARRNWVFTIIGFVTIVSCSSAPASLPSPTLPSDGFGFDPFGEVQSASNLLTTEQTFTAFVNGARRVTQIDTGNLSERWGWQVQNDADFLYAISRGNIEGVALVATDRLTILERNMTKTFFTPSAASHWHVAEQTYSFAFLNKEGTNIYFLHHLEGSSWQESTTDISEKLEPKVNRVLVAPNASHVLAIDQLSASYRVFEVTDEGKLEDKLSCTNQAIDSPFMGGVIGKDGFAYLIDFDGRIYQVSITAPNCKKAKEWSTLQLGNGNRKPLRIVLIDQNLYVSFSGGHLYQVTLNQENFNQSEMKLVELPCEFPRGLASYRGQLLRVNCSATSYFDSIFRGGSYEEPATLLIVSLENGSIRGRLTYDYQRVAAMAIDPDKDMVYLLYDSSLGSISQLDLHGSTIAHRRGLFTRGIID